jgi:sulfhydrogenase subunit delta
VFLELLQHVEIVEFREAMSEQAMEAIDIAFIEGSFTRGSDRARLEEIRRRSRTVIAYGACAATAGINALKNHTADYAECVYGHDATMLQLDSDRALPISAAIRVDHVAHGCPVNKDEVLQILSHLLHGKRPVIPGFPVCVECKRRETICRYDEGDHCLGQVARAGCGAPCPASRIPCEACRGFVDEPNEAALTRVLIERARFPPKRAEEKTRMFTAVQRAGAR